MSWKGYLTNSPLSLRENIESSAIAMLDAVKDHCPRYLSQFSSHLLARHAFDDDPHSYSLRYLLTRFFPWDPLIASSPNPLEIAVLTSPKDLEVLSVSLISALRVSRGEIRAIYVVGPASIAQSAIACIRELPVSIKFQFCSDEELLASVGLDRSSFSSSHAVMQVVKLLCPFLVDTPECLVLDGDTIFLRPRTWSSKERFALVVAQECHGMHLRFNREILGIASDSGLGFTTQSQLLRRDYVANMTTAQGGWHALANAFSLANLQRNPGNRGGIFPSEVQVYGDWCLSHSEIKSHVALSAYSNVALSRNRLREPLPASTLGVEQFLDALKQKIGSFGSVSFHAYL